MFKRTCMALVSAVLLLGSSCPPPQGGSNNSNDSNNSLAPQLWSEAYGTKRSTSFDAVATQFALPPFIKWQAQAGALLYAAPVIGPDGIVWIGNAQGEIVGVNPDGSEHRRRKLDDTIFSTAAVNPDTNEIFVLGQHKNQDNTLALHLYRLDAGAALLAVSSSPMSAITPPKLWKGFVFQPSGGLLNVYDQATLNLAASADATPCFHLVCGSGDTLSNVLTCIATATTAMLAGIECYPEYIPGRLTGLPSSASVLILDEPDLVTNVNTPMVIMLTERCATGFEFNPSASEPLTLVWSKLLVDLDCDFPTAQTTAPVLLSTANSSSGEAIVFGVNGQDTRHVLALDPLTGDQVWDRGVDEDVANAPITTGLGELFVLTTSHLITLNTNGVVLDTQPLQLSNDPFNVGGAALSLDFLYIATDQGVHTFTPNANISSGGFAFDPTIAQNQNFGLASLALAEDGTLYASNAAGLLVAYSPQGSLAHAFIAPLLGWQAPADGATLTSAPGKTLTVSVGPGFDGTVRFVSNPDGTLCDHVIPSGGTANCITSKAFSIGAHMLTAFATDSTGATKSATITVQVVDTPPSVTITDPTQNAVFKEGTPIGFTANVSDPDQTSFDAGKIQWQSSLDGAIGTGLSFNKVLSHGTHTITCTATDNSSLTGSANVTIIVTKGPIVTIQAPAEGASLTNGTPITFTAKVTDTSETSFPSSGVKWKSSIDGDLGTGMTVMHALSNGNHTITATATDTHGLTGQASIHVTVNPLIQ